MHPHQYFIVGQHRFGDIGQAQWLAIGFEQIGLHASALQPQVFAHARVEHAGRRETAQQPRAIGQHLDARGGLCRRAAAGAEDAIAGLAVFGDAWSLLILRDAHAGLTRLDQFRKSLGIVPTMLTRRLASLTQEGLLEKHRYSETTREEYLLTDAGRDLLPVLFMLGDWGRRHRCDGQLSRIFDAGTGTEVRPVVIDEVTGQRIGTRPLRLEVPKA